MSSALDHFERELVRASRALHAPAAVAPHPRARLLRRARHLNVALQLGLAVTSAAALTGGAAAGYLLLTGENRTRTLAQFECEVQRNADAGIAAVTGDPLVDCATEWPAASGGRSAAPRLAMWGTTTGKEVAVVRPAAWGQPTSSTRWHWRRLPAGWTVDLGVVAITDQLANISVEPAGISFGAGGCMRASDAVAVVRSLLRADQLRSWRVVVRPSGGGPVAPGCRQIDPIVGGATRTVELLQRSAPDAAPPAPRHGTPAPKPAPGLTRGHAPGVVALPAPVTRAERTLQALYTRVDGVLATRCESVAAAAALWMREARAVGFTPTTLAFYRWANAHRPGGAAYLDHYTLFQQPASQHTGACAHVLVMVVPGSGLANVYAARIAP